MKDTFPSTITSAILFTAPLAFLCALAIIFFASAAHAETIAAAALSTTNTAAATPPVTISVTADPSKGALVAGKTLNAYFQASNDENDLAIATLSATSSAAASTTDNLCKINGVDVSQSFVNLGNGDYEVSYTVAPTDANKNIGEVPIFCELERDSGKLFKLSGFTDDNTVAIDAHTVLR